MDGSLLVASTEERIWAWAALFCLTAAASLLVGLVCWKKPGGKIAMGCFALSVLLSVLILPSVRNEYIHASPRAITIEPGNWYRSSKTTVEMVNVKNIFESDVLSIIPANLIGDPNLNWQISRLDGRSEILELNDFFSAHRMVLAYYYKDRGFWFERLEDRAR